MPTLAATSSSRMYRALAAASLLVSSPVAPASSGEAQSEKFEASLRQAMERCKRPGYVLKPVAGRRLLITALPYIRQTPLSTAELNCIRREVRKIRGWSLAIDHER